MNANHPERLAETGAETGAETRAEARRGGTLLGMGVSYAMGTFNDNFFKQAALLLAAAAGLEAIQGLAATLFALPFVLCSAWAGWLADRLPKSRVVVWSKALELAAMLLGVWTLAALSWTGMLAVVFLMGLQSAFFSPALNGAIPEQFPEREVPGVNALLKLATTLTILLGIAAGGLVLDIPDLPLFAAVTSSGMHGLGRTAVGGLAVLVSIVGLAAAFAIRKSPAPAGEAAPFPLFGPLDSLRHARACRGQDPQLFLVLMGEAFFYGFSSFALLCINNLGVRQLGFSLTLTSLLSVALMVGICAGSLLAGRHEAASWRRFMLPACCGMGLGLLCSALAPLLAAPLQLPYLLLAFTAAGLAGGLYLIPLVSFVQVRPGAEEKGKVLGISNFASFSAIILTGLAFSALGTISPALLLAGSGLVALLFASWAKVRLATALPGSSRFSVLGLALRCLLGLRYRITATGLADISGPGPTLFLPNHPALIDPVMVYALLAGHAPRPLSDERQLRGPLGRLIAKILRAILIPDILKEGAAARSGVRAGLKAVADALRAGDNVLLYPAGKVYRSGRESLGGASATAQLLRELPGLRVVLVRTTGLWGSSFSYGATGKAPDFGRTLGRGFAAVCANLLFFTPRREVTVEFVEAPADLPRDGDKRTLNAWLERFYNETAPPPLAVPRFFWQVGGPTVLPDPLTASSGHRNARVAEDLRKSVYAALRKAAKLPEDHPLHDAMTLSGDLSLDSLALMELALDLEAAHGKSVPGLEKLHTVEDCLLAAAGLLEDEHQPEPAPQAWFKTAPARELAVPKGASNIAEAFFLQARQAPDQPLLADRASLRTRRELLMGALILARRFRFLPGERLGVMLPATPAAAAAWLAVLLAGKTPVFCNWTVGEANLRHCLAVSGITHILSAGPLLDRLEGQGLPLAALPVTWLRLDELAASLSIWEKLRGLLAARFPRLLRNYPVPEVAAVLFTSGSETRPKAVPLTHANLLTNARDIVRVLAISQEDSILAMLPPFHSFGLMVGLVLPLALGIRAAFHPNPTEPGPLAALIRDFKLTLAAAPPTFLEALLERARGTTDLAPLRYAFAGAEKCPDHVYRAFAAQCPQAALCEGYGITECSPVVSVNRPDAVLAGSIGHVLPSVTAVVVREEEGAILGRAQTDETGMLLLRGPSIFHGYLGDAPSPFVDFEGQSWYRSGDLVSMDATGRLVFRGRLKRFVKLGGEMISLPQIESALLEAFSGRPGAPEEGPALAVEASPDELGPEVVLFTPLPLTLAETNAALRQAGLSPLYAVKRIVGLEAIPLLGSGKTDYRALKERLKTE